MKLGQLDFPLLFPKGTVIAGCEEFSIVGIGCSQKVNGIWPDYPQGTRGKAGPAASVQLQLARNNSAASSAGKPPDQRQHQFEDARSRFLSGWVLISR